MTAATPCYRHRRRVWMAACPDCRTWHLAAELARRGETAGSTTARLAARPGAADVLRRAA